MLSTFFAASVLEFLFNLHRGLSLSFQFICADSYVLFHQTTEVFCRIGIFFHFTNLAFRSVSLLQSETRNVFFIFVLFFSFLKGDASGRFSNPNRQAFFFNFFTLLPSVKECSLDLFQFTYFITFRFVRHNNHSYHGTDSSVIFLAHQIMFR